MLSSAFLRHCDETKILLYRIPSICLIGADAGHNEAFLIDTATRDKLVNDDPSAAEIIMPYLRGQDIGRWEPDWNGLWMIFARRGIHIEKYPSVLRHLEGYRAQLEPKPDNWQPPQKDAKWPGRKAGTYRWYEIQDAVDYYASFNVPKILLRRIVFYAQVCTDQGEYMVNDSALILPKADEWIVTCLNSPIGWYFQFKKFPHKKDEALAFDIPYVRDFPIPSLAENDRNAFDTAIAIVKERTKAIKQADRNIADWLRFEFPAATSAALNEPSKLDSDGFVAAVRAALPKRQGLTPTQLRQLRDAFAETAEAARQARSELLANERSLAAMVVSAYGLTEADVSLMWRTAPPRMPVSGPL